MSWRDLRRRMGRRVRAATGADDALAARHELVALRAELVELRHDVARAGRRQDVLGDQLDAVRAQLDDVVAVELEQRRHALDRTDELQARLAAARTADDYEAAYSEAEPLITVRIASYQRTEQLVDVALASVFAQSYTNIEVVIVNDGPNPRTRQALEQLDDPRIRYEELAERGRYPEHPTSRWRVAGTAAGNRGLALARGRWIAPLDDDDAFTPDHLERLLALARATRAELAYGAVLHRNLVTGVDTVIWSDPPELGAFSLHGALYHGALASFTYEPLAWTLHEPGDWNLTRRMLQAGVRVASTPDVVGTLHWVPIADKPDHPWSAPS